MPSGIKTKAANTRFIVRCVEFETDPYPTAQAAAKCVQATIRLGACPHDHQIVEVGFVDGQWLEVVQ